MWFTHSPFFLEGRPWAGRGALGDSPLLSDWEVPFQQIKLTQPPAGQCGLTSRARVFAASPSWVPMASGHSQLQVGSS